eukprot:1195850-Prorocentrum_minimum.AAC.3
MRRPERTGGRIVDLKGCIVDLKGYSVDLKGYSMDLKGCSADMCRPERIGGRIELLSDEVGVNIKVLTVYSTAAVLSPNIML